MTSTYLLSQGIGLIGVLCFILSFQISSNRMLFLTQGLGCLAFSVQFLLVGAYTGCLNLIVIIIRNVLLMKFKDWKWVQWKGFVAVFGAMCFAVMLITWAGPLSILPFLAVAVGNIGMWTNNAQKIRLVNLVCSSPAWLVYDFIVGSYSGVLNECIVLASILVSIYRYGWRAMGDPDSKFQK